MDASPQAFSSKDVSVDTRFVTSVVATRSSLPPSPPAASAARGSVVAMSTAAGIPKTSLTRDCESTLSIAFATVVSAVTTRPVPGFTPPDASDVTPGAMPVKESAHASDPAMDRGALTLTSPPAADSRLKPPNLSVVYCGSSASSLPLELASR